MAAARAQDGMPFLELDKLTKRFGDQLAVDSLSLVVDKGEFVTLLGPSGCGKTTTLQMIAGFADVTSGNIRLEGRDLLAVKPARRGLGIVFQSYALFPHMTAGANVAFGLEMQGVGRAEREARVSEALALVGLAGLAERYPRRMSGGQQQRVALARALVIRPRILLLDEPLSNLDAKLREEMQIELRQLQRTLGTTTILVTHDQAEAMALSDRVVVMNSGRVEQIATPQQAYERPASPFVARFLGRTNELEGQVSLGVVKIGTASWFKPSAQAGEATLVVRPEKIALISPAPDRLNGIVRMRVFQGNHWLYRIETPAGAVLAIRPNAGEPGPAEGDTVGLSWSTDDMVVRPRSEGPS